MNNITDKDTQNASIALYQYMCQNIVGTEEYVKTLRIMSKVRDSFTHDHFFTTITSGSFGEGLVMRGSDFDFMDVMKNIEVFEDMNINFKPYTTYLKMKTNDTPPGYTQLHLVHSDIPKVLEACVEVDGEYYFSNMRLKEKIFENFFDIYHGPCLSDKNGKFDLALCVHSKSWITHANQWITRSNNSWPENDVKQSIVQHGVLFVPVGIKGSKKEESEWRISFSVGEQLLVYTFTHTQLLCYALMKILLKDVIAIDLDCKELLCSYFLKTILFWISEELPPSQWITEKLISCFMKCLRRLLYCVEYSVCPHYFIPENNLFKNKIKGKSQQILLDKLYILNSYGWQCILFSDQISNIFDVAYCMQKEISNLNVEIIERILFSVIYLFETFEYPSVKVENEIHRIMSFDNPKIKHFYAYYLSKMFSANAQLLPFPDISGNKSNYKRYNTCISTVLRSIRHNAVSGWLLLASFIYQTKQYKKSLAILQYSLSKCTSEKLYRLRSLSNSHYELLNFDIFRRMPIVKLFKFLRLDSIDFCESSYFKPVEIQNMQNETLQSIPPVVFAHFLRFLCYYHLNDNRQCQNSLCDLQLTIEENYFIAEREEKAASYNILGITFETIGDIDSARQAFMQSIQLLPEPKRNIAFRKLSLIS